MKYSLEIHGIAEDTLRGYLLKSNGETAADGSIAGPGWVATVTRKPDYVFRQMRLCCFVVELEGEEEAAAAAWERFKLSILRPGG
jgi:hypothetical protein